MPTEERNYYVLCDDNCRFPAMTKEQVIAAIAEATGATPTHIDDAFITKIKESNANAALTMWKGTQSEFNALGVTANAYKIGIDAANKIYFTPATADDLPTHAYRHGSDGDDPISPESIGALPVSGGTMEGALTLYGAPTNNLHAATKKYVDDKTNNAYIDSTTITISKPEQFSFLITPHAYVWTIGKLAFVKVSEMKVGVSDDATNNFSFKIEADDISFEYSGTTNAFAIFKFDNDGEITNEVHWCGISGTSDGKISVTIRKANGSRIDTNTRINAFTFIYPLADD